MKSLTIFLLLILSQLLSYGQVNDICGVWLTEKKTAHIKITRLDNIYQGQIIWVKDIDDPETGKPWVDSKNPDPSKHSDPILGMTILNDFVVVDEKLEKGTIYNSKNGKTYEGELWLESTNILNVRGYLGFFFSTQQWTRVK